MDATLAINAMVNGNLVGMVDALDASETYDVVAIQALTGEETLLGRILVIGSTVVHLEASGTVTAHGHATDAEASECAEIGAIRHATLGLLAEGGRLEVRDAEGNLTPAASLETAQMLAIGFPVPPEVMVAEAQAARNAEVTAMLTLGVPGTMDGPPAV